MTGRRYGGSGFTLAGMTNTQEIDRKMCPVTGRPYVRDVRFEDSNPHPTIHVPQRVWLDDHEITDMVASWYPFEVTGLGERVGTVVSLVLDASRVLIGTPPSVGEPIARQWVIDGCPVEAPVGDEVAWRVLSDEERVPLPEHPLWWMGGGGRVEPGPLVRVWFFAGRVLLD